MVTVSQFTLVDDLPAELDRAHCASVCAQLGMGRQVILTAVDRGSLEAAWAMGPLSCSTWNKATLRLLVDSLAMALNQNAGDRQLKEHRKQRDNSIM